MAFSGPGPGRPKGAKNKTSVELKGMIEQALNNKGGVAYLEKLADEQPQSFATLLGRILPKEVHADVKAGVVVNWPLPKPNLDG